MSRGVRRAGLDPLVAVDVQVEEHPAGLLVATGLKRYLAFGPIDEDRPDLGDVALALLGAAFDCVYRERTERGAWRRIVKSDAQARHVHETQRGGKDQKLAAIRFWHPFDDVVEVGPLPSLAGS